MHGFLSKKELYPIPAIAGALAKAGIASLRFDFDAHGRSEGPGIICFPAESGLIE